MAKNQRLNRFKPAGFKWNRKYATITVLSVAIVGASLIAISSALTSTVTFEPEKDLLNGNASLCNDANASNNQCVQFGGGLNNIQVSQLPSLLGNYNADYGPINTSIFCGDQLSSALESKSNTWRQFFTYFGTDRQPYITSRTLPNGNWQTPVNLKTALNTNDVYLDGHNCIIPGIDPNGYIMVSMRNKESDELLHLAVSNNPFSLNGFTNVPVMVNKTQESPAGYVQFFNGKDGSLMMVYSNGVVGSDLSWYLNRWDTSSGTPGHWVRVRQLTSGTGESMYIWRVAVDRSNTASKGRMHIFGTWRVGKQVSGGPVPNDDLVHYYSDDNGLSWKQYGSSSTVSSPITYETGSRVLNTSFPGDRYINNQGGMDIDSLGRPHAMVMMSSSTTTNTPRLHHVWYDGSKWHIDPIDSIGGRTRSSIICDSSGNTWGFISASSSSNTLDVVNLTPGSTGYLTQYFSLVNSLTLGSLSAKFDSTLANSQNTLSFMFSQVGGDLNNKLHNDNYRQIGFVETLPLNKLGDVATNKILIPKLKILDTKTASSLSITGTNLQKLLNSINISNSKPTYIRITATAKTSSTSTTLTVKASKTSSSGDLTFGRMDFKSTSLTTLSTPWLPAQTSGTFNGILSAAAQITAGTGSGTISSLKIEVASLEY